MYGTKAVFFPDKDEDEKKEDKHKDKEVKVNVERTALQLSNVALIFALASRWAESGHFPLSNMYESLLFLAWGTTATAIYVNSNSKVFGALVSPVALFTVAGATLGLPKELQRASALVPALKSNWLMMHVSVMMMSYATLLAGSLACMGFLALELGKDNETVGKLTEKMEKAMFKDNNDNNNSNEDEDEMLVVATSRQRSNRPKIDSKTGEQVAYAMESSNSSTTAAMNRGDLFTFLLLTLLDSSISGSRILRLTKLTSLLNLSSNNGVSLLNEILHRVLGPERNLGFSHLVHLRHLFALALGRRKTQRRKRENRRVRVHRRVDLLRRRELVRHRVALLWMVRQQIII